MNKVGVKNTKTLCKCDKMLKGTEIETLSLADLKKTQTAINPTTKRIITTRNAATSPNLDLRKIENKILYINGFTSKLSNEAENLTSSSLSLENSNCNSLKETKPQKMFRTTRSMSPRPPVRQQKAIIISDEQAMGVDHSVSNHKLNTSPLHYMKVLGYCRSEQTSPKSPDVTGISFRYNDKLTNKSAEYLPKVATDPWLHITELKGRHLSSRSLTSSAKNIDQNDPWIKRIDKPVRVNKSQFRQTKSFSGIRSDVEIGATNNRPPLTLSKSPIIQDFKIPMNIPMQSAPSSPNFLSVNNSFSLGFPLGGSLNTSPVRTKQSLNPFLDNSPLLSAYLPTRNGLPTHKIESKRMHLNINQSVHLLQARHSFSSLSPDCAENELPLNIRRLSQQMRKEQQVRLEGLKASEATLSSSEQNVKQPLNVAIIQLNKGGADFSEYLQQHFQCGRTKNIQITRDTMETVIKAKVGSTAAVNVVNDASLLETTC